MAIEQREESDVMPGDEAGDLRLAVGQLVATVFQAFPDTESSEHRAAMMAMLELHQRLSAARHRRRLN
jgi:hypothetical protein